MSRRDEVAVAFFATWMITGLFVDGWAHNADKPESFWTPWHALLYSGFGAAMAWGAWEGRRERGLRVLLPDVRRAPERLLGVGAAVFIAGAVGDMVWHEAFGVEVDVEALLSPSHLTLLIGGLLMATAPLRSAWHGLGQRRPSLRAFLPALVSLTLAVSLVAFFLQFASAFRIEANSRAFTAPLDDGATIYGILSVQVSNLLLIGPMLLVLRRWHPPPGTFTVLSAGPALFMSGLLAFDHVVLVVPALAGGALADWLVARGAAPRTLAMVVPLVTWSLWFTVYAVSRDFAWTVELWSGSILFTVLAGVGLSLLAFPPTPRGEART